MQQRTFWILALQRQHSRSTVMMSVGIPARCQQNTRVCTVHMHEPFKQVQCIDRSVEIEVKNKPLFFTSIPLFLSDAVLQENQLKNKAA
jgi:hypothetical protein